MGKIETKLMILLKEKRLTLIIGSGVNKYAIGNKSTTLKSWCKLLDIAFKKKYKYNSQNYILEFEKRLVDRTSKQDEKAANRIQNEILENICKLMKEEQTNSKYTKCYPTYLFNKEIIGNVVSLNFDLIPELIISRGEILKLGKRCESLSKYSESNISRYREIDGIRFWHPNGDIQSKKSIVLGMRQYINNLEYLEDMRRNHKSPLSDKEKPNSWYEAIVYNPVLVLESRLSDNELDIWGALINRERNYAKMSNRKDYRPSIYIMWSECESRKLNKPDWVKPFFSTSVCYDIQ